MSVLTAVETLGGVAATARFKALPEKGVFAVGASTDIRVVSGGAVYPIDINSQVVFTVSDFQKEVRVTSGHCDLRGVNKRLIRPDMDTIDTIALRNFVTKAYSVKTDLRTGWVYSAEYVPPADSHITLLYNMLTSWYKAVLWQGANAAGYARKGFGERHTVMTIRRINYRDSHVTVTHQQDEDPETDVEVIIGPPNDVDPSADDFVQPFSFNAMSTEKEEVVLLPHISKVAYTWYIKHLAPKSSFSVLNFDAPLPGVEPHRLAVRTTNGNDPLYARDDEIDWTDASSMWQWMSAYVVENRVESHFAAAFEIFSAVAYRPIADTAEGFLFSQLPTVIHLPTPKYYRARFPGLIEDDPWMVPAEAQTLLLRVGLEAHAMLAMAGVSNYIAHIGGVSVATEGILTEDDPSLGIIRGIHSNLFMERAPEHRAACIYAVLGREVSTNMTAGMGVIYPVRDYFTLRRYPFARKTTAQSDVSGFDLNAAGLSSRKSMPLPASPALLLGHASDQLTSISHCRPMHSFNFDKGRGTVLSLEEAFRLANVYRIAGYDPVLRDVTSGAAIRPFSSLKAISLQLSSMAYTASYDTPYLVESFKIRNPERLQRLPTPEVFMDMGGLQVSIVTSGYNMEKHDARGVSIVTNYRRPRELKRVDVRISGGVTIGEIKVQRPRLPETTAGEGFHGGGGVNLDAPQETAPEQIAEL